MAGAATQGCCREEPLGLGSGLLIPCPQPGSSPGTCTGMGMPRWQTPVLPTAIPSLCQGSAWQSQGGDSSILDATHWGQEPKHFYLPESNADSPTALAGWGQLQPDRPLSSHRAHRGQGTTLGKPADTHTAPHGSRLPHGFPLVSCRKPVPGLPSASIPLLWHSRAAGIHLHSIPMLAAPHQHQGRATCWGRAITQSDWGNDPRREVPLAREQQLSCSGTWGSPCPGSRDGTAGWAALEWQQRCCSRIQAGSVPAQTQQGWHRSLTSILEDRG